ncbi:MAG TPA: hypothetical protein IAA84_09700, partial [Candidatus Alectryocaccomicrobium excrementavium]|nr:hypothetical protein [Candidatus Alectryocaccomicrobium excrementavium]
DLQGQIEGLNEQIATLTEQASAAQGAQEQLAGYEQQVADLQGQIEGLNEQIATLTEQASAAQGAQEQLAGYEQQVSSLQGEVNALKEQVAAFEAFKTWYAALYNNLNALRQAQEIPGISVYQDANTGETVDPLLPEDAAGTPIPGILPN